jgi:asparagine synthase (glutamine-hydrolysing)
MLTGLLERLPARARQFIGGPLARSLPASARAKTRMRRVRRLIEGIDDQPERRYLRWMTVFDEPARVELYSDDLLADLAGGMNGDEDSDPASVLVRSFGAAPRRDPITRAMISDLLTYLPGDLLHKVDMASMAHSLECRGPFLDHRVVELALAMPLARKLRLRGGRSKVALKQAFPELLPPAIRTRPKMGFGVPIDRWFRGELKDELRSILLDPSTLARGLFRPEVVRMLIDEHAEGRKDHAYKLWAMLMLELWFRRYGP